MARKPKHELQPRKVPGGWIGHCSCGESSSVERSSGRTRRWHKFNHLPRTYDLEMADVIDYLRSEPQPVLPPAAVDRPVDGGDWARLNLLIKQTEARVELWEAEELHAERRWHRGLREVDGRGLSKPETVFDAVVGVVTAEKLWVPESKLDVDRATLANLYRLRREMLESTDGSECQ